MVMVPSDASPHTSRYLKWLWKVLVFHNLKPYLKSIHNHSRYGLHSHPLRLRQPGLWFHNEQLLRQHLPGYGYGAFARRAELRRVALAMVMDKFFEKRGKGRGGGYGAMDKILVYLSVFLVKYLCLLAYLGRLLDLEGNFSRSEKK